MVEGFTVRAFSVLAGSEEFPTGSSNALCRQRSEVLLTKSVQCIIDANRGWQLDPRNSTDTSYTEIPAMNSGQSMPGLFLRNSISGCKMFISYFGVPNVYSIMNFSHSSNLRSYNNVAYQTGLIISIIPENSESEFGDPSVEETFIPNDATRLVGSAYGSSGSVGYNPVSGRGYAYFLGVTPYCILVSSNRDTNDIMAMEDPMQLFYLGDYIVGRILESVSNGEEATNAKYGVLCLRTQPDVEESWAYIFYQEISSSTYNGQPFRVTGVGFEQRTLQSNSVTSSISKADGSWVGNSYNSDYRVIHFTINPNLLGFHQSSGNIAWSAIGIMVSSNDLTTYGVTPTDGFKGILDTTLFRAIANGNRGDTFDNGKFIVPEDNVGLLLGWDSSNDNFIRRKTISTYYGTSVKIPSNYVVWSVTLNIAYDFARIKDVSGNNITLVLDGRNEYTDVLSGMMIQNYPPNYPTLRLSKGTSINTSVTPKMQIIDLTKGNGSTAFTVTESRVDSYDDTYGDYFILLKGTSSDSSIKDAIANEYPFRLFLQTNSSGNVNPTAFKLPTSLWSVIDGHFAWLGDTSDQTDLAYYYANDWGAGSSGIVFNINLVDPKLIMDTIEIMVCLRWDTSSSWLAKTWSAQDDWWWSGIRNNYDKDLLEVNSVGVVTKSSAQWCGTIGGVRFNPNYDYSVTALYSDLNRTEIDCDIDNFFIFSTLNTFTSSSYGYPQVALIKNIEIFSTNTMCYSMRITKTGGNKNQVLYLTLDDSITVGSNTNLWYPLYKLNGEPIEYTGIPLMRSYFSSNSSDEAKTDHPSLDFQFRNNNGFLECKYTNTTKPITLSSIIVSWNRHEAYFNADRSAKYFSSSTQSFLYENGKVLYLDPAFEYIPINYFKPSDNSWIAIPGPYATCECFLRGHGPTGFSSWLKIYHTNTSYDTLLLLQYKKIPATLFTAWLNSDKTPQTISEGMNIALYNNAGDVIPVIGTTIKYERYVVAYYYTDGVRHNNFNGTDVVLATANEDNLTIVSNINSKIERVEYSIQPEFIT